MKQLLTAAVIIAALGGALYYFFEMRKTKISNPVFKEEVIGTWKIDSVILSKKDSGNVLGLSILAIDSNYHHYVYQFANDGLVEKKLGDSLVEKLTYQMKDSAHITFVAGDSTKEEFSNTIVSFNKEQFTLLASDSSMLFFKKQK